MANLDIAKARRYLEMLAPICENGYVTIHHKKDNGPGRKATLPGNAHKTIDSALKDLSYWVQRGVDTYMCLAATDTCIQNGNRYPIAVRKGEQVIGTKALWIDMDIKEDGYASPAELRKALSKFIDVFLAPSFIVESGGKGGAHVYWICDEFIPPIKFDKLSKALAALARDNGVKFDSACTVDRVRVLRPAGTYNFKYNIPDPVKIFYDKGRIYTLQDLEAKLNVVTNVSDDDEPDDVLQQPKNEYPLSDIDQVATACPFIAKTIETGGKDYSEPLWTWTVMLASYCANPKETAIRLSNGHEKYFEQETVDKVKYHIDDHKTYFRVGPPKCETFNRDGATECKTCPHLKLKRSPLNVPGAFTINSGGTTASGSFKQPVNSNDLPYGYFRGKDQHIYGNISKKIDGVWVKETVKVFPYLIKHGSASVEPNCADYHMNFITYEEGSKEKEIILPFSITNSSDDAFRRQIASNGCPLPKYSKETREFFVSYQEMLRSRAGGMVRGEPIGWTMKNGEFDGFSFDGQSFSPNSHCVVPKLKGALLQNYTPMGSPQPWIELAQVITEQQRPGLEVILLSGFAAPLVPMTGHSGIILGCYSSETGIGKSTSLETSTAVWGHPVNSRCGLNDTINMAMNKAGAIRHLPLNWDEVKTKQQFGNLASIIFQMTEGREKGRLNRSALPMDMKDFQTMLTYAANSSVLDAVQESTKGTSAGIVRDFEFRIPTYDLKSNSSYTTVEVQNMLNKLKTNYGMIGLEYAKYLGENGRAIHKSVIDLQTMLETKYHMQRDERYWFAAMTVILSAAKIVNALKWANIDMITLGKFLVQEFARMRKKKDRSPTDYTRENALIVVLSDYLSINRSYNTIVLNKLWLTRGRPPIGAVEMEGRGTSREHQIRQVNVAIGREDKMIHFTDNSLSRFCTENNIPVSAIREGLRNIGASYGLRNISAGTQYPSGVQHCWLIELKGTPYERKFEI
jgi:hypothetical protein